MDTTEDIIRDHDGESDIDSDNDENICRTPTKTSPQKSPLKLSAVLKRKRRLSLSEPGSSQDCQPGNLVSYSDDSEDDLHEDGEQEDEDEECMIEQSRAVTAASSKKTDFVFKEPSFRKKQFIFHPFKSVDGVLSPDTDNKDGQVTVTIPEQLGNIIKAPQKPRPESQHLQPPAMASTSGRVPPCWPGTSGSIRISSGARGYWSWGPEHHCQEYF